MQFSSFQSELVPQKQWKELSRNCFRPGSYLCYDKKVIGNITFQAECLWSFPSIHLIGWIGGKQGACFSLKTFSALSYSQLCESICPSVPFIAFWVAGWRWEVLRWEKDRKAQTTCSWTQASEKANIYTWHFQALWVLMVQHVHCSSVVNNLL